MRVVLRGHVRIRAGITSLAETQYRVGLIYTQVQRCPYLEEFLMTVSDRVCCFFNVRVD